MLVSADQSRHNKSRDFGGIALMHEVRIRLKPPDVVPDTRNLSDILVAETRVFLKAADKDLARVFAGDAVARDPADARRDFLDRRHQRICEEHGPADAEAKLRSCLAIGADPRRIVIRSARNQPGPPAGPDGDDAGGTNTKP